MRTFSSLVALSVGVACLVDSADALHRHSSSRAKSHVHSHTHLHRASPCDPTGLRVFKPQLNCAQQQAPKEPASITVVAASTCKDVISGIQTRTAPYWDPENNRCAAETRTQLLTQCADKMGNTFTTQLQALCHFDTKVFNQQFHPVRIINNLPDIEVPTGVSVPTKTGVAESQVQNVNYRKTPAKPIEAFAAYPTDMTESAQQLAKIAQGTRGGAGVPVVQSYGYGDSQNATLSTSSSDPVILESDTQTHSVKASDIEQTVRAPAIISGPITKTPPSPLLPQAKWASYPSNIYSATASSFAVSAQRASGVLPKAPTVVTVK